MITLTKKVLMQFGFETFCSLLFNRMNAYKPISYNKMEMSLFEAYFSPQCCTGSK